MPTSPSARRRFGSLVLALTVFALQMAPVVATEITTDLWIYQYGDTVTVTGIDFGANESVEIVTTDPYAVEVDRGQAQTDEFGGFAYQFVLLSDVPGIYDVVGTGLNSGLSAATQFDPVTVAITNSGITYYASAANITISGTYACSGGGPAPNCGTFAPTSIDVGIYLTNSANNTTGPTPVAGLSAILTPGSGMTAVTSATGTWTKTFAAGGTSLTDGSKYDVKATFTFTPGTSASPQSAVKDEIIGSDKTGPVPSVAPRSGQASPTNSLPIEFDVTFNESTIDGQLTPADISLAGSTANVSGASVTVTETSSPATDNDEYRISVTGITSNGTVAVAVVDDAVTDGLGNLSSPSGTVSVIYDSAGPLVTVEKAVGQLDPTSTLPIVFRVTFNEPIQGNLGAGSLIFGGTADRSAISVGMTTIFDKDAANPTYDVSVGNLLSYGTLSLSLAAGAKKDVAGNDSSASTSSDNSVEYVAPVISTSTSVALTSGTNASTYGDSLTFTATVTGSSNPSSVGNVTFSDGATVLCASVALSGNTADCTINYLAAGSHSITAAYSGGTSGGSTWGSSTSSALDQTVNQKDLDVTADDKIITYGDSDPAFTFSYDLTDFVFTDGPSDIDTDPTCDTAAPGPHSAAGSPYTITCTGGSDDNYNLVRHTGSLTVNHKDLTVVAEDKSRYFGEPNPPFTFHYLATDFVLGDDADDIDLDPTCDTTATQWGSLPGLYAITCSGGSDDNYNLLYPDGTLSISAWTLKGFYQPVDMPTLTTPVLFNTVKGGSTVPLKFEIFSGLTELTIVSYIESFTQTKITCSNTAPVDDIEFITTGHTVLRFDGPAGQFIQNWQTPKLPGQCYRVTMKTIDGSALIAYFKLK